MAAGENAETELDEVMKIVQMELGKDWKILAGYLGLSEVDVQQIEKEKELVWQGHSTLVKWRQRQGRGATVERLLAALKNIRRQDIVDKLYPCQEDGSAPLFKQNTFIGVSCPKPKKYATDERLKKAVKALSLSWEETDECISAFNEYLESGKLAADLQEEFEKIGFHSPLQVATQSTEQLEEKVAEIVEEAMDVFLSDQTDETTTWGDALLRITAWTGDEDKVKTLLQAGVQVNTEDSEGETPLWDAVRGGNPNIVSLLLQEGADTNTDKSAKLSCSTLKYSSTPLCMAAESGNAVMVSDLIQVGADLNQADKEGRTPLFLAAQRGHTETVRILTQAGADLNKADSSYRGKTPLMVAAESGHGGIVSILKQAEADK
ncbi:hypothetical protein Bbelb_119120 [Branchiostoma belcheri]|nr:hypothetical protein Bbelb_119120 [Branchiostoma belcheri]